MCRQEGGVSLTTAVQVRADMKKLIQAILSRDQRTKNRSAETWPDCHIAESAVIHPEATIDNLSCTSGRLSVGEGSQIRGMLLVYKHGGSIAIGNDCFLGIRSGISSMTQITIGNRVLISHDVQIYDSTAHSLDPIERHLHYRQIILNKQPASWAELPGVRSAPILIEDDVWIGFGCSIMKGVRIGKGSVIAARSIVTHDVEPGMLYMNEIHPKITPLQKWQSSDHLDCC